METVADLDLDLLQELRSAGDESNPFGGRWLDFLSSALPDD